MTPSGKIELARFSAGRESKMEPSVAITVQQPPKHQLPPALHKWVSIDESIWAPLAKIVYLE